MCGEVAMFECPECFDAKSLELSSATFCEPCSKTVSRQIDCTIDLKLVFILIGCSLGYAAMTILGL